MAPDAKITDENGEVQTNNMLMTPYYMQNGVWVERTYLPGEPGWDNKIPVIRTGLAGYDTLMFKCKILDNAGHYSEEVETPGFIIN